ncbi:karyopherin beta [Clydaea vesicula]|uniref:Importin-95 n=1 Tax=Clydaea vesicula TaxID=447962 RepID=A0AAD5U887_9FUNG|nr:karyopherin beta [Clydaea vesicula]KAJ3397050.1 karyopherin beta [Lobulomyces angularis]
MNLIETIKASQSPDHNIRQNAQQQLDSFQSNDLSGFLINLSTNLLNTEIDTYIKTGSALLIKNALTSKDSHTKQNLGANWLHLPTETRNQVKINLVQALSSQDIKCGTAAAQAIAAVAGIELPVSQWLELIPGLLQNINTDVQTTKQASLQAIGFICEIVDPAFLSIHSNSILTAVAQGARKEESNEYIRLAAIQALINSIEFIKNNFDNEGERNYIMQIVCEATQSKNAEVQVSAFECLVKIVATYYDKMQLYMEKALFGLTISGMNSENDQVALQAVEFWSTICETELDIILENQDLEEIGETPERVNFKFSVAAVRDITPVLLNLMTKKEDDDDEDEWNVSMAASTCLALLSNAVSDPIVQPVLSFVEQNIRNSDWRFRESAVMAFGCILEGPDNRLLAPLITTALPVIIELMKDPVIQVKDTTAWCLGKICEVEFNSVASELPKVIEVLLSGLVEPPRVAVNACWALLSISSLVHDNDKPTYILSPYFDTIIDRLMVCAARPTSTSETNLKASTFEAISSFVENCADDCLPTVEKLTLALVDQLDHTVAMQSQLVNADDRRVHNELQSNLCTVVTSVVRRLEKKVAPLCDRLMHALISIMRSSLKSSTVMEDVFLTVGSIAAATEKDFLRYMDPFSEFLYAALQNHEEHAMCSVAVGTVGDICRALSELALPYCDNLMHALVLTLQSEAVLPEIKPIIISCFGDIALAIGGNFENYLGGCMSILNQAAKSSLHIENEDYSLMEFNGSLKESIVEAYVGIVQGMKSGNNVNALIPYVNGIFEFLKEVIDQDERNESTIRSLLGLIGDLAEAFPPQSLANFYAGDWIDALIKRVKVERMSSQTREIAKWVREIKKRQQN